MIPVETLHDLLRLDPETGRLHWRERGPEYPKTSKWRMQCRASGRRHTGYFDTEVAAAAAYDAIAKVHHGAFARLNFPELGATA